MKIKVKELIEISALASIDPNIEYFNMNNLVDKLHSIMNICRDIQKRAMLKQQFENECNYVRCPKCNSKKVRHTKCDIFICHKCETSFVSK